MKSDIRRAEGFTLVEIAIVMVGIGLLVAGILGGATLIENRKIQTLITDLRSFDSSGGVFKENFRQLPGDITEPSVLLANCTSAPCSTPGNGDSTIGRGDWLAISATDEEFTFWHHLLAANLITSVKPTTNMEFGEGQPMSPLEGGYRMVGRMPMIWATSHNQHVLWVGDKASGSFGSWSPDQDSLQCAAIFKLDGKIDDGLPKSGRVNAAGNCTSSTATDNTWTQTTSGLTPLWYVLAF